MSVLSAPLGVLRRGRAVSSAVANAWQSTADDARDRAERERLAPGREQDGPGNWLDAIGVDDCWCLLATTSLGRVGFTAHSGHPLILPVNYSVVERQILIRTGRGPKLEAARRGDLVAFEVDQIDNVRHTGWSVTITGRARWVRDQAELVGLKFGYPTAWAAGPRDELIVIEPIHIGGRTINPPTRSAE